MIETAIILSLATAAIVLGYLTFQLKDKHNAIKMVFSSLTLFFLIGTVFTGYIFALNGASTADLAEDVDSIESVFGEDGTSTDSFGTLVARNTRSLLNLPGDHPIEPERWRVLVDGERAQIEYRENDSYSKEVDHHKLVPNQGETVALESAESVPYFVHYEQVASWALQLNRSLETGDRIRFGMYNNVNGYFIEHNSTNDNLSHIYMVTQRNGSKVRAREAVLSEPLTKFTRFELRSNWYGVGEQTWIQTHTDLSREDVQENDVIGQTAPENNRSRSPETPTLPVRYEVHRGSGNSALSFDVGSAAILSTGDIDIISRQKADRFRVDVNASALNNWLPVAAIRLDTDEEFIRGELIEIDFTELDADTDGQVMAKQHNPELVLNSTGQPLGEGNWVKPNTTFDGESIVEFTKDVVRAPNAQGRTVAFTKQPGGFQTGWGSIYSTGNKGASAAAARIGLKRPLYGSDVTVFWVRLDDDGNPSLPTEATFEYITEQDY